MNKFALFVASLLMSVTSFAQWTKPAAPQRGFNIVKYSNGLSQKVLIP